MASSSSTAASIADIINDYITSNEVMVFSKSYCPYCLDAKDLLGEKNIKFKSIELDEISTGHLIQDELLSLTGQYTVPSIFIKREHIGGCDDLHALNDLGELDSKLN